MILAVLTSLVKRANGCSERSELLSGWIRSRPVWLLSPWCFLSPMALALPLVLCMQNVLGSPVPCHRRWHSEVWNGLLGGRRRWTLHQHVFKGKSLRAHSLEPFPYSPHISILSSVILLHCTLGPAPKDKPHEVHDSLEGIWKMFGAGCIFQARSRFRGA